MFLQRLNRWLKELYGLSFCNKSSFARSVFYFSLKTDRMYRLDTTSCANYSCLCTSPISYLSKIVTICVSTNHFVFKRTCIIHSVHCMSATAKLLETSETEVENDMNIIWQCWVLFYSYCYNIFRSMNMNRRKWNKYRRQQNLKSTEIWL